MILAVDPGSKVSGWAIVTDDGRVVRSGVAAGSRIGILSRRIRAAVTQAFAVAGAEPVRLVIERHPVTHRKGAPTDAWGPGLAAGLFVAAWESWASAKERPPEPRMVAVRDWRRAMLGRTRGRDQAKRMAVLRAREELAAVGLKFTAPGHQQADEAESLLLGIYAAKGER